MQPENSARLSCTAQGGGVSLGEISWCSHPGGGSCLCWLCAYCQHPHTGVQEVIAISLNLNQGRFCHLYGSEALGYLAWLCPYQQHTFTQDFSHSPLSAPSLHSSIITFSLISTLGHILPMTPSPSSALSGFSVPISTFSLSYITSSILTLGHISSNLIHVSTLHFNSTLSSLSPSLPSAPSLPTLSSPSSSSPSLREGTMAGTSSSELIFMRLRTDLEGLMVLVTQYPGSELQFCARLGLLRVLEK